MNKRIVCVFMALVLALASLGVAFAEAVPSITVSDIVRVTNTTTSTGVALPENFSVVVAAPTETSTALVAEIATYVQSAPVISFFGETAAQAVAAQLPEGVDASSLTLSELQPMFISNYDAACGDVVMTITTAAEYADGTTVVAMVGIFNGTEIVWYPLEASIVGGNVEVKFTQEVLLAAAGNEISFALLSAE